MDPKPKKDPRPITEDDWEKIADMMDRAFGHAEFVIDGYKVALQQHVHKKKIVTMTYVNGVFKGEWSACAEPGKPEPKHEEAKRFLMPRSRRLYSEKELKRTQRLLGKRKANECRNQAVYWFEPLWRSAKSLRRHFEANNKDIQIIETISIAM